MNTTHIPSSLSTQDVSSSGLQRWAQIGRHGGSSLPQSSHPSYGNINHQYSQNENIIKSIQHSVRQLLKTNKYTNNPNLIPSFLSGTLAFYATAFTSQCIQYKILKMSTGTKPHLLPVMVGATTVALGSWVAHLAGVGTTAALNTIKSLRVDVNDLMNKETFRDVVPIMGQSAIRSVKELTRPMKLMFGVYGGSGGGSSISGLTRSERKERRDAWMHAARM